MLREAEYGEDNREEEEEGERKGTCETQSRRHALLVKRERVMAERERVVVAAPFDYRL